MAKKKGSFIEANKLALVAPASQLLAKANNAVAINKGKEAKSVRLNLLTKPSIKKNLEKLATVSRVSVNELINQVLQEYIATKSDDIEKYNSFYGEE